MLVLALLLSAKAFGSYDANLVAWYTFDDNEPNTTVINRVDGVNGIAVRDSCDMHVMGKVGGALEFDGISDRIEIPHDESMNVGTGDFSICLWADKFDGRNGNGTFYEKGPEEPIYTLQLHDHEIELMFDDEIEKVIITTPVPANGWHFICATADRDGFGRIYIDGVIVVEESITTGQSSLDSDANPYIGTGEEIWYQGSLDNFMIFNKALTPFEVFCLYLTSSAGFDGFLTVPDAANVKAGEQYGYDKNFTGTNKGNKRRLRLW
jgi:hypothetical protein